MVEIFKFFEYRENEFWREENLEVEKVVGDYFFDLE